MYKNTVYLSFLIWFYFRTKLWNVLKLLRNEKRWLWSLPPQLSQTEPEKINFKVEKKLFDPINHSADEPEGFLMTRRLEGTFGGRRCFYCKGRRQHLQAAQTPFWTDSWWKCQCSSPALHLQSGSGRHVTVNASHQLSITPGRDIIVLKQVKRRHSDDRWGVRLERTMGKKIQPWRDECGVWMSEMNSRLVSTWNITNNRETVQH